ncbi:hypothetical protein CHARACLAT_009515 [Characodon lateralis]|uniref:Uncharacterized protein n=1 Tax=Characodon lateralis TaxID=208331 RepID=A0ABU7DRM9_9TELE|nr:hypothetical protein [Characodon lateralis]
MLVPYSNSTMPMTNISKLTLSHNRQMLNVQKYKTEQQTKNRTLSLCSAFLLPALSFAPSRFHSTMNRRCRKCCLLSDNFLHLHDSLDFILSTPLILKKGNL